MVHNCVQALFCVIFVIKINFYALACVIFVTDSFEVLGTIQCFALEMYVDVYGSDA